MTNRERLTDERIRRLKFPSSSKSNQFFLWDDDMKRLAVRITMAGVKSFIFESKLDGETIRWTIGSVSDWTLEAARKEARRLHILIDKGIDPREQDRQQKAEKAAKVAAIEANQIYTLKALLKTYTDYLDARDKRKSAKAARSVIKVHILEAAPALAEKPANKVTADEIFSLIQKAREAGKERTAGILRSTINAAYNCARKRFDTAIPIEFKNFNIANNPVDPISSIPVRARHRTLSKDELKSYMAALGDNVIDMALKLALYTGGQRMAELLRAEVNDWNPDTKTLRLFDPKGNRKQPREHLLPLGPVAASIVQELVKQAKEKGTPLLFPSKTNKTPIDISMPGPRVTKIFEAIGGNQFDLRDLRRTCETMLAGMGVSRDIRAQLLSHGISGVQAQHYDKHDYIREKHTSLLKWERHLNRIVEGNAENAVIQFSSLKK